MNINKQSSTSKVFIQVETLEAHLDTIEWVDIFEKSDGRKSWANSSITVCGKHILGNFCRVVAFWGKKEARCIVWSTRIFKNNIEVLLSPNVEAMEENCILRKHKRGCWKLWWLINNWKCYGRESAQMYFIYALRNGNVTKVR